MVKSLLQGKPLGHPLHPALVHLPVGLLFLSFLLDMASWIFGPNATYVRVAFYTMAGGVITALTAAVPGVADWSDIRRDHPGKKFATLHMLLNIAAVALYICNVWLRYGEEEESRTPPLPLVLSLVGVALLSASGWIGGHLIYNDGIAVGRHRRRTRTPPDTISKPVQAGDDFVDLARESQLADGETLRAEVAGCVITIVRLDGEFFAFQEFCTHRYGPLSEGTFHGKQVMCPWHRSCFDVRTGKVTEGPAKVDLKTFEVKVRDGQIAVRVPQTSHAAT